MKLEDYVDELGSTLGETLMTPTRIYVPTILSLLKEIEIRGMAHITGGGMAENLQRIMPAGLGAEIDMASLEIPAIFQMIARLGNVPPEEMFRTFNMGIGYIMVVAPDRVEQAVNAPADGRRKSCGYR